MKHLKLSPAERKFMDEQKSQLAKTLVGVSEAQLEAVYEALEQVASYYYDMATLDCLPDEV